MDFRIELVPLAVADVDRSVAFYGQKLGWSVDHDSTVHERLRFVQVTPPGSACSICFGVGLDMFPDGAFQHVQVVVEDAEAAHAELTSRGVDCTEVSELAWGRFVSFTDPDGNLWSLQQLPSRG